MVLVLFWSSKREFRRRRRAGAPARARARSVLGLKYFESRSLSELPLDHLREADLSCTCAVIEEPSVYLKFSFLLKESLFVTGIFLPGFLLRSFSVTGIPVGGFLRGGFCIPRGYLYLTGACL